MGHGTFIVNVHYRQALVFTLLTGQLFHVKFHEIRGYNRSVGGISLARFLRNFQGFCGQFHANFTFLIWPNSLNACNSCWCVKRIKQYCASDASQDCSGSGSFWVRSPDTSAAQPTSCLYSPYGTRFCVDYTAE